MCAGVWHNKPPCPSHFDVPASARHIDIEDSELWSTSSFPAQALLDLQVGDAPARARALHRAAGCSSSMPRGTAPLAWTHRSPSQPCPWPDHITKLVATSAA